MNFINSSTGVITTYAWSFGDGGTSNLQNPSHVYSTAGVYTVGLTITGPGGSSTKTRANFITVTGAGYVSTDHAFEPDGHGERDRHCQPRVVGVHRQRRGDRVHGRTLPGRNLHELCTDRHLDRDDIQQHGSDSGALRIGTGCGRTMPPAI